MKLLTIGEDFDNIPVQVNLDDPTPGSILIIGDKGVGKTRLLNSITLGAKEVPLCSVYWITNHPEEIIGVPHGCIRSFEHSGKLLSTLVGRMLPDQFPPVILLIDGLDNILEAQREDFFRLFNDGPRFHIWPFVTLNSEKVTPSLIRWMGMTRMTTIFGRVADRTLVLELNRKYPAIEFLEDRWFWTKKIGMIAI